MNWIKLLANCGAAYIHNMDAIHDDLMEEYVTERRKASFKELANLTETFIKKSLLLTCEEILEDERSLAVCTTNEDQKMANNVLEEIGFTRHTNFINPNSNNEVYLWSKDLAQAEKEDEEPEDEGEEEPYVFV